MIVTGDPRLFTKCIIIKNQKNKYEKARKIIGEIDQIPAVNRFLNEFKSNYEAQDFSQTLWRYIRQMKNE